jgi:hypothetical protein
LKNINIFLFSTTQAKTGKGTCPIPSVLPRKNVKTLSTSEIYMFEKILKLKGAELKNENNFKQPFV